MTYQLLSTGDSGSSASRIDPANSLRRSGALVVSVSVLTLLSCSLDKPEAQELRIGLLADLPTPGGQPTVNAAQMAIDRQNRAGGVVVNGARFRLKLIVRDTQNNPTTAMEAARELIYQQKVGFLIGPNISRNAIPVTRVAEQARVPMLSPGSTDPETTLGKKFAFRMSIVDEVQGEVMADFAINQLRARRAAILYDVSNPSNKGVSEAFIRVFTELGGKVASAQTYVTGDRDYEDQLRAIERAGADVLFLPNRSSDVAIQAQRARGLGIDAALLGSDNWSPHKLQALKVLDGAFFCHHWHVSMRDADSENGAFVAAYERQFGESPAVMSALTYDAVGAIIRALHDSRSADSAGYRDSLAAAAPYDGITGRSVFRGSGNPAKNAVILQYQRGQAQFFKIMTRVARAN